MMMGVLEVSRIFRQTDQPSMEGSMMSRMTRSGWTAWNFSSPSRPSPATWQVMPSFSRYSRSRSAMFLSSSTIRILRGMATTLSFICAQPPWTARQRWRFFCHYKPYGVGFPEKFVNKPKNGAAAKAAVSFCGGYSTWERSTWMTGRQSGSRSISFWVRVSRTCPSDRTTS